MPTPYPELDWELANATLRSGNVASPLLKLAPKTSQTAILVTPVNTDATVTLPTGYTTLGGIGSVGLVACVKTTAGVPADTDFSGATPVVTVPPLGTLIYSTSTHKLYARDAAGSWLATVAFT